MDAKRSCARSCCPFGNRLNRRRTADSKIELEDPFHARTLRVSRELSRTVGRAMLRRRLCLLLLAWGLILAAGCASTPQASRARDAAAKEFRSHPATAALYVYRENSRGEPGDTVLFVDGRLIGATLPEAFFRVDVQPGRHVLHGFGYDNGQFALDARPGEIYFIALDAFGGSSFFALVDEKVGRRTISRCCALLENWAPGQRPLLR